MATGSGGKVFGFVNNLLMFFISLSILYPFLNILAISLNDGQDARRGGIYIWPRKLSFLAYETVFSKSGLLGNTMVSIARTVLGTLLGLAFTSLLAYILSNKELVFRRFIIFLFVFTMYFSGGIMPDYLLVRQLGLYNNFLVYIIPCLLGVWNVMVMRQFFEELPPSLVNSAKIDGASEMRILTSIILPISTPVLATVALFIAVSQWSAWYDTYIYTSKSSLSTLQNVLVKILRESQANIMGDTSAIRDMEEKARKATPEVIKMATIIITTAPIVMIYPFLQKYFVKGIMIGAVKE